MQRHNTRTWTGVIGAVVLTGALALVPVVAPMTANAEDTPLPDVNERRVLTDEHVDAINVGLDGTQLTVNSKISPPVEFVEPEQLIFQLSDLGYVEGLPPHFVEFIGSDSAWVVPQTQNHDVIWAGWSTEDIGSGVVDGNAVNITLADVHGPGDVEVWQTVGFGDVRRIFSSDEDYKTVSQSVNSHVHANWAFTEPGVYTLTFGVSATVGGELVESGPVDFTWTVGGAPGDLPDPATSVAVLEAPPSVPPGEEFSLNATVSADTGLHAPPAPGGYVEFHSGDESLGWASIIDGQAGLAVSFGEVGEYEITSTYTPQEPQFYAGSVSEPHLLVVDEAEDPIETTLTIEGLAHHYHSGDAIELTAVQNPSTELDHYHWFGKAADDDQFVEVGGGAFFEAVASPELDDAQYYVELYGHDHEVVAISEPVTIVVDDHDDPPGNEDPPGDEDPPGECEDPRTVLTNEHTDLLTPKLDGTELELWAKVDSSAGHTFYQPSDLLVQVKDPEAATSAPGDDSYAFLGEAGDPLWVIPQTQDPDVVWAGWSTEELPSGAFDGNAVEMILHDVEGPGEVEVFQTAGLGEAPRRIFSSVDVLDPLSQRVGQHVHANWAFTALGEYTMTFEVAGALTDGDDVSTGHVDFDFVVGDIDCDPDDPGDENGGDENGADENGGDENGADENGGDVSGGDDGTDTGGDDGTDTGGDDGADENGGDTSGDADGADTGGAAGGEASGGGNDSGAKPTTKPTTGICPPGTVPSGSQSGAGTPPANSTRGADADDENGEEDGEGTGGETGGGDEDDDTDERLSGDPVVLTNEHVDLISPRLSGSALSLEAKVGSSVDHTFYDPADVLVQVKPEAQSTIPDGDAYAFLGDAGDAIWLIPETQNLEIVWAGWSTEELSSGDFRGDAVNMRMLEVDGPGTLEVFQAAGFGDVNRIFSSEDSLDARRQGVGQHVHANWAFSAEGSYTVTFEVSGTLADGTSVSTGAVEYSFVVGAVSGANQVSVAESVPSVNSTALRPAYLPSVYAPAAAHQPENARIDTSAARTALVSVSRSAPVSASTPGPSAAPASESSPSPATAGAPAAQVGRGDDCVLARTGAAGISGLVLFGGLMLVAGSAALYAYRRRGVTLLSG